MNPTKRSQAGKELQQVWTSRPTNPNAAEAKALSKSMKNILSRALLYGSFDKNEFSFLDGIEKALVMPTGI